MKFLEIMKKFDKAIVKENKKLKNIYSKLLKESSADELAQTEENELEETISDTADNLEQEAEKCPECKSDPCTCDEVKEAKTYNIDDFFKDAPKDAQSENTLGEKDESVLFGTKVYGLAEEKEGEEDDADAESDAKKDTLDETPEVKAGMKTAAQFFEDDGVEDEQTADDAEIQKEGEEDELVPAEEFLNSGLGEAEDDEEDEEDEEEEEDIDDEEDEEEEEDIDDEDDEEDAEVDEAEANSIKAFFDSATIDEDEDKEEQEPTPEEIQREAEEKQLKEALALKQFVKKNKHLFE